LGLYDCCGVSDGAACAILTTPEIARSLGKRDLISVKALQLAVSNGVEAQHNSWDGSYFATTRIAAKRAYHEAGIDDPRRELYLQLQGRAGPRQRHKEAARGLVHNLGGFPHQNVCSIAIVGRHGA